jgi:succinoglycan biosynthesis transport protein ExoP
VPQSPGFTDMLLGERPAMVVNHVPVDGGTPISLFTSGTVPSNPSEMLSGRRTSELLAEMSAGYDYVIVDSAPVLPVSDSVALAGAVDGLFIVAQARRVTEQQVVETVERLGRVSAPILGLVLNQASGRRPEVYSYGGYAALSSMPANGKLSDPVAGIARDE